MPTLAAPNLETMRPPGNPDDLVELGYRPVFKEHTNRAGQRIGSRELARINNRCNERIEDTGDFAPIVIRHTKDDGSYDPEVIGFLGPYRMSKFGRKAPLAAIEGKVWIYSNKVGELKKYPRLSVEYWADEKDPGNGYFDPVSLLGAETPELDLGIHYSKIDGTNHRLMRYSRVERFQAVMAGGSNTFVPNLAGGNGRSERDEDRDDGKGEILHQYDKDSTAMAATLTPADIQQIVAAMVPIVTQQVSEAMQGMKGGDPNGDLEMGSQGGDDLDLGGAGDDLDLDNDPDLDLGDDLDGMGDGEADPDGDGDLDIDLDGDGDVDAADGDVDGDAGDAGDAMGDDLDLDGDGDDDLPPEIDDEDTDMGVGDDSDLEDADERPDGDVADDDTDPLESEEDEEEEPMADAKAKGGKKPVKFSKQPAPGMTVEKYAKENAELRERYHKATARAADAEARLAAVESEAAELRSEKTQAMRYAKLTELELSGCPINVNEELKDTAAFTDDQFDYHCNTIVRYSRARAPIGASIYVPASSKRDGSGPDEKRERYAKVAGDAAKSLVAAGKSVDYAAIRANVERNDGKYVPEAA